VVEMSINTVDPLPSFVRIGAGDMAGPPQGFWTSKNT
jgi:hypothetical protein